MAGASESTEIEWQFDALDLRPVERWLAALPSLPTAMEQRQTVTVLAKTPRRLVDTYLDTDDWRVVRAGFVLRTRRRGRLDEITLKDTHPAGEGGLRERLEVTEPLPPDGVTALGDEGPVGRRVRAVAGRKALQQVLQVRTRRRPFALRVGGVDAAEVALDETTVMVGNGQRPMQLQRVEVEVLPEWLETLRPIVEQLRESCGLQPATLSKFEAGLLALGAVIPGPPDLGSTSIGPQETLGELAYAVLRRQLAAMAAHEPGTRLGEDPEELHDMRVATRRLRAAIDLFAEVLPVRARGFRDELGWMASMLGHVRDLDVQQEAQAAMSSAAVAWGALFGEDGHDPLAELHALLERERQAARADMLAALDSVRWERLVSGMSTMVQQGPLRRSTASRLPAVVAVPDLVATRHGSVVKAARRARRSGKVEDFHRLRIRCKRLRYSLEFSAELYGGRTSRYTKQLTGLQDQLGYLQDAEVAAARLADLATGEAHLPPTTVFVMGGVAERHRLECARLLRTLPKELSRVGGKQWQELADLMDRQRAQALALMPPLRRTLRALPRPEGDTGTDGGGITEGAAPDPVHPVATLVTPPGAGSSPLA